jgi:hypothetical protein
MSVKKTKVRVNTGKTAPDAGVLRVSLNQPPASKKPAPPLPKPPKAERR